MVQGSLLVVQAARLGRSQRVQRETVHLAGLSDGRLLRVSGQQRNTSLSFLIPAESSEFTFLGRILQVKTAQAMIQPELQALLLGRPPLGAHPRRPTAPPSLAFPLQAQLALQVLCICGV